MLLFAILLNPNSFGNHNLDFLKNTLSSQISVKEKSFKGEKYWTYFDGLGREAYFRGWNVSGSVKLTSMGFKPFKNSLDAKKTFREMSEKSGANAVRFTISWEGVHSEVDKINQEYLEDITSQIREAIANNIYIILDYHQDLFSRYLFNSKSKTAGNGAPKFIIEGGSFPQKNCFICFQWAMNYVLHKGVTKAFRGFWDNSKIETSNGTRLMQDEFLWQLQKTLEHLKNNLTEEEFSYILGLDPFNEPMSGGREGLSLTDWNKEKLYPFYFKIRKIMNKSGWDLKTLFAEPVMDLGAKDPFYPEFLKNPPKEGWAFNSHFYDVRQIKKVENGAYIFKLDKIKEKAQSASLPPFLTEFGYWKENGRVKNHVRKINAIYQGMEISKEKDSNFAKFFSPLISGTQWNWDIYHNRHKENLNFTNHIITDADAWNGENYSIVTDGGVRYDTPDRFIIERSFPKRCQGEILHFYYNAIPFDGRKELLKWGALKFLDSDKLHLSNSRFSFLVFKEIKSEAPTEIFIPSHFNLNSTYLITENKILNLSDSQDESIKITGHTLYYWAEKNPSNLYFSLLVDGNFNKEYLTFLQKNLKNIIQIEQKSPVFLNGKVRIF